MFLRYPTERYTVLNIRWTKYAASRRWMDKVPAGFHIHLNKNHDKIKNKAAKIIELRIETESVAPR